MSRNVILMIGVVLWTAITAYAVFHLLAGDMIRASAMPIAFGIWYLVRGRLLYAARRAEA